MGLAEAIVTADNSFAAVMARKAAIMKTSVGIDYARYATGRIGFDYERLMADVPYSLDEVRRIQAETCVGSTPLVECRNITRLIRKLAPPGKGARLFIKDEAANPSGSFKDRRAALSVYHAVKLGYPGIAAATSGNYGAGVACQAAKRGLRCIIVQEVFDSTGLQQPEITEKSRACEAAGAEVLRLSVGPELFFQFLRVLEETGFFNASLYTPYSIAGIETLGWEIGRHFLDTEGRAPDAVVVSHAGGGNLTGTARGLRKAGCAATQVVAASVDLRGLHMASDHDFNRKSFTTAHTGFGVPFATMPDRSDVPRNAARPLRYMDRYVTVTQGEVFFATEMLAQLEGLERGPAGNTSLAAAFVLAQQMDRDQIVVVQETEYTGAGKHPWSQLGLAKRMGIEVRSGDPRFNEPGRRIVIPEHPAQLGMREVSLDDLRCSYLKHVLINSGNAELPDEDIRFLAEDIRATTDFVRKELDMLRARQEGEQS